MRRLLRLLFQLACHFFPLNWFYDACEVFSNSQRSSFTVTIMFHRIITPETIMGSLNSFINCYNFLMFCVCLSLSPKKHLNPQLQLCISSPHVIMCIDTEERPSIFCLKPFIRLGLSHVLHKDAYTNENTLILALQLCTSSPHTLIYGTMEKIRF